MYISGNDAPEQPHQRLTARTRASRFARTAAPYLAAFAIPFCVLLAAFAAAFTANALHSTPVYDSLKERILDQRRRRRAAASPTEERS